MIARFFCSLFAMTYLVLNYRINKDPACWDAKFEKVLHCKRCLFCRRYLMAAFLIIAKDWGDLFRILRSSEELVDGVPDILGQEMRELINEARAFSGKDYDINFVDEDFAYVISLWRGGRISSLCESYLSKVSCKQGWMLDVIKASWYESKEDWHNAKWSYMLAMRNLPSWAREWKMAHNKYNMITDLQNL
jgi:hypothetical protein